MLSRHFIGMIKNIIILFLLLIFSITSASCQTDQFKLQAEEPSFIEQALLNQAIDNDPVVKSLDKQLNKTGFVRDIGNLGASTLKSSIRIINLSHYGLDMSARFVTNGINLGSDLLNVTTVGYKLYKVKKIKEELESRIDLIKKQFFEVLSRLNSSKDDIEARNKLTSLVGEKSANDYLNWLEMNAK